MTLSTHQRNTLRKRMTERAGALRREIGGALRHTGGGDGIGLANQYQAIDDEAVADLETDIEIAEIARDERELAALEGALARIDAEGYGYCADCGAEIDWERLEVQPQALRCLHCESVHEAQFARSL